ncbi:hypothetical protein Lbir_2361 [Legionella birminghamensis]|uniref:Uncharacterized protein n=1 Tax=Legionella birminghamensis TaxID=28083 RepID=A0A378IEB7_9GAMM|nr:hypothetical protein [Legionella birminghamensis]KTC68828.1 hypothetical protein Lbir_2361 [Legionella birminghamensis]STX33230.1 Uncharacterised protein [Legionella birminghamensis]
MQIQPVEPLVVLLNCGEVKTTSYLVELTEHMLSVTCTDFLEKGSAVLFKSRYFRGEASIITISYDHYRFTYTLEIEQINFQPGLLVNTQL